MDERIRQLQRLAAAGDADAQQALERWQHRTFPQCTCKQQRLLLHGCKCGYGPERPIFELETVLRLQDYRIYYYQDEGFEAWNRVFAIQANPFTHTMRVAFAAGFDRWSVDSILTMDYPYTWEEWADITAELERQAQYYFGHGLP